MDWQPIAAALAIVLWVSLALVFYSYVAYPLVICVLARYFGSLRSPPLRRDADCPHVSLLIAALNEEKWIEERVLNALAQDYPADRLEVVIASDGSTDATAAIVEQLARCYPGRVRPA